MKGRGAQWWAIGCAILVAIGIGAWLLGGKMPLVSIPGFALGQNATTTPALANTYIDPLLSFSFAKPAGAEVSATDSGQHTVTMTVGNDQVQVAVLPFDEDVALTSARIKHDIPNMPMNNIRMGAIGAVQTVFFDTNDTREAWFVYDRNLYQISELLTSPETLFTGITSSLSLP